MKKLFSCFFVVVAASLAQAETHILECERFKDLGGWKVESQFHAQLGSSYLIAHGMGRPVADATTTFTVATGGTYKAWVLTKNWTAKWSPNVPGAGRFFLIVNGETAAKPLGADAKNCPTGWFWQYADSVTLKAGENTVALHDATGFDGRVDAVCFTTLTAQPGNLRKMGFGVEPVPTETTRNFDLVVAGGGVAGITTAISAARLGLKVALVQNRPILGGNNSSEVRVHLGGWCNVPPYERLGDVVAEIGPAQGGNAEKAANYEDDRKLAAVKAEKNITLFLNTNIEKAETKSGKQWKTITSVTGVDVVTGARTKFVAPLFADCTGDGAVGQLAGAWFNVGREPRAKYGEPSAPEKGDSLTMGASVQWNTRLFMGDAPFAKEPWMIALTDANAHATRKGDWNWETGMGLDQIGSAEDIRDYGLLVAYSNFAHVKNSEKTRRQFGSVVLDWVAQVAGKRESRRLMGDFMLTENHLVKHEEESDGTCAATWTIDLHTPQTAAQSHFAGQPFLSNSSNILIRPYPIPYRCLYSKNVENLFMAGRNISVSHVALGTTRLMRTCGMMGEVVGMAASVCKAKNCTPRDVYKSHFDELKALMTKGVGKGGKNPPQTYNNQSSLDREMSKRYMMATWGRLTGKATASQAIEYAKTVTKKAYEAGRKATSCAEGCKVLEDFIVANESLTEKEKIRLYYQCLEWARHGYDAQGVERYYEAIMKLDPNYKGDEVFQARSRACYNALQAAKTFPLAEKDIKFGQTLKSMGVVEKKTVHLKDFYNPTNVTAALQKLIDDPEVTTIVLDKLEKPYYLSSVTLGAKVTGKRILLKSGVKVLRDPNFLKHRCEKSPGPLFDFKSCENVILESDAAKPSDVLIGFYESRHERLKWNKREGASGLHIGHENYQRSTKNVVIRNVRVADCECDGLSIGPLWNPCEEIFVENVILDSNFRQGCSPCAYYSLYFKNVTFSNTCGGQPMAGLDVEPWEDYLSTCVLYLFDCTFEGNLGGGFLIATTTHEPILIYAKRCTFKTNGRAPQVSVISMPQGYLEKNGVPKSSIRFEDCSFSSRGKTFTYAPCPIYNVTLKDCTIRDARGENERKRSKISPICITLSRDFGISDIPAKATPSLTLDNVKVEGFEGAEPLRIDDEMGMLNLGKIFHGAIEMNGKRIDLSDYAYRAPDLDEPKTAFVPLDKLRKPVRVPAADEKMTPSPCTLIFSGAWWIKQPIPSYYFWADQGRKVSFDFTYTTSYPWIKAPDAPLLMNTPNGREVKFADISKGKTNLTYVATATGWHRFTPGLTLDAKSTIGSCIEYYVSNVKGAAFAWQADTTSDSFAKFKLTDKDTPYTAYFEVPAGGKPCRIRANYGGFILKDPAGNIVGSCADGEYSGRYVFTIKPTSAKAEIWSLTSPAGTKGGWTRALRFYAPLNGIWADSPETLPCLWSEHFVPAKKAVAEVNHTAVRIDRKRLTAAQVATLDKAIAARKAFAEKKEHAARRDELERQIDGMKKKGVTDDIQHQIDDLTREVKIQDRLARMEAKAAKESSEAFEVAAFCQAFSKHLVADEHADDFEERIAEELRGFEIGYPRGVIEYEDDVRLAPLVDVLYGKLAEKGEK